MAEKKPETPLIIRVIEPYASLAKSGDHYIGYCPICEAVPPKMVVRPDLGQWHCYSCGRGGDVVDFLAAAEQVSHDEAQELLAAMEGRGVQVLASEGGPQEVEGPEAKLLRGLLGHLSLLKGFRRAAVVRSHGVAAATDAEANALAPSTEPLEQMLARSREVLGDFNVEESFAVVMLRDDARKLMRIRAVHGVGPLVVVLDVDPEANEALFVHAVRSYLSHHPLAE